MEVCVLGCLYIPTSVYLCSCCCIVLAVLHSSMCVVRREHIDCISYPVRCAPHTRGSCCSCCQHGGASIVLLHTAVVSGVPTLHWIQSEHRWWSTQQQLLHQSERSHHVGSTTDDVDHLCGDQHTIQGDRPHLLRPGGGKECHRPDDSTVVCIYDVWYVYMMCCMYILCVVCIYDVMYVYMMCCMYI